MHVWKSHTCHERRTSYILAHTLAHTHSHKHTHRRARAAMISWQWSLFLVSTGEIFVSSERARFFSHSAGKFCCCCAMPAECRSGVNDDDSGVALMRCVVVRVPLRGVFQGSTCYLYILSTPSNELKSDPTCDKHTYTIGHFVQHPHDVDDGGNVVQTGGTTPPIRRRRRRTNKCHEMCVCRCTRHATRDGDGATVRVRCARRVDKTQRRRCIR